LPRGGVLAEIGARHGATPYQVALAWVLRQDRMIAIPKAGRADHVRDNAGALGVALDDQDLVALDLAFPPASPCPLWARAPGAWARIAAVMLTRSWRCAAASNLA
jgi:diketogulonate reductase-like aldo/keto reductase